MKNINTQLVELISVVINIPTSDLDMDSGPAIHSSWDSLAHVTIITAVEETYGISLTMPEILSIKTVRDLENFINRHNRNK